MMAKSEPVAVTDYFGDDGCIPLHVNNEPIYLCSVEQAARIVGQKWTLQIVNVLMDFEQCRFCELQDALGGVIPGTLSTRRKMLEEEGILQRSQISAAPLHVVYRLTPMGEELSGVIRELTNWSRTWLCGNVSLPNTQSLQSEPA